MGGGDVFYEFVVVNWRADCLAVNPLDFGKFSQLGQRPGLGARGFAGLCGDVFGSLRRQETLLGLLLFVHFGVGLLHSSSLSDEIFS